MTQRVLTVVGAWLAALGLLAILLALVLPWGHYRVVSRLVPGSNVSRSGDVSVFDAPRGILFVVVAALVVCLVALAGFGAGRARQIGGLVGPLVGLVAAVLAVTTVRALTGVEDASAAGLSGYGGLTVRMTTAAGGYFGLFASPLLGFGSGLLSLGRLNR